MTSNIIPEDRPLFPPGSLLRPFALALILAGVGTTFWFQQSFLRDGAVLGAGHLMVLASSYLPFVLALPLIWRRAGHSSRRTRGSIVALAVLLPGSSWLALSFVFLGPGMEASGLAFIVVPSVQLLVLAGVMVLRPGRWGATMAATLLLALVACDSGPSVSTSEPTGEVLASIWSTDGAVELALTGDELFFRLSDDLRSRAEAEVGESLSHEDGLGRAIGGVVTRGVRKALALRMTFDLGEVEDVRMTDGLLVVDLEGGPADLEGFIVNDREVTEAFSEDDVARISRALAELKATR